MIASIIKSLRDYEHPNAGECTEIAKGKYELVTKWKDVKRKIKRYGY